MVPFAQNGEAARDGQTPEEFGVLYDGVASDARSDPRHEYVIHYDNVTTVETWMDAVTVSKFIVVSPVWPPQQQPICYQSMTGKASQSRPLSPIHASQSRPFEPCGSFRTSYSSLLSTQSGRKYVKSPWHQLFSKTLLIVITIGMKQHIQRPSTFEFDIQSSKIDSAPQ
uniref:Tudor domain-containing protein n=1 Tax=Panagrellus redivivus TaxID=6233 RepID=A0A7E4VCQ7_PANRE